MNNTFKAFILVFFWSLTWWLTGLINEEEVYKRVLQIQLMWLIPVFLLLRTDVPEPFLRVVFIILNIWCFIIFVGG